MRIRLSVSALFAVIGMVAAPGCGDGGSKAEDAAPDGGSGTNGASGDSNTGMDADSDGGSDDTGGDNGTATNGDLMPGEPITLEEYAAAFYAPEKAWQQWVEMCCVPNAQDNLSFPISYTEEYDQSLVDNLQESIDAGRTEFHGEYAAACAESERAGYPAPPSACAKLDPDFEDGYYRLPARDQASCEAAFKGLVEQGGECDRDVECKAGLRCNNTTGDFVCTPVSKAGDACGSDGDCEAGLYCVGPLGSGRCAASLGAVGAPCGSAYDCEGGLSCSIDTDTCIELGGFGDDCEISSDCTSGYTCGLGNTCEPEPLLADGQTCGNDYVCESGWCNDDSVCASFCMP